MNYFRLYLQLNIMEVGEEFFFHMELKQLIFLKQNYLVTVEHLLMKKNHFVCL